MNPTEANAWFARAKPREIAGVRAACEQAWTVWIARLPCLAELVDCAAWCPSGLLDAHEAIHAASNAAAELAVVVAIWPATPGRGLRRVAQRRRPKAPAR